jgi:uracil-DNA glycosylase family 4
VTTGLDALAAEIVACRACPRLVAWREEAARVRRAAFADDQYWGRPVPGFGDPDAWLTVVGLAPAAHGANRTGRMFTGDRSGDFLFAALHRAGLCSSPTSASRDDGLRLRGVWITAPVRCAPPANKPTAAEVAACRPFFDRELRLLTGSRVVLALGAVGYRAVVEHEGLRSAPRFAHGLEVQTREGRTVLSSYHVSQQNTFTGRLTAGMFDEILARAQSLASAR